MNPWGFLIIGVGVLAIIIGVTGSYESVKSAITGKAATTTAKTTPTPPTPAAKKTPTGTMV
jgi:hypothetical protein